MSEPSMILITGGLGFIGLRLAESLLKKGHKVVLFDNLSPQIHGILPGIYHPVLSSEGVRVVRADILDRKALEQCLENVEFVVHLAAETGTGQSMYEIAKYNEVNTQGTALLLDILVNKTNKVRRFVLASSRSVYGEGAYLCADHGVVTPEPRVLVQLQAKIWEPKCPDCDKQLQLLATNEKAPIRPSSIYAATKFAQEELVRIGCGAAGIEYMILRFQNVYGAGQSLQNPYTGILSIFSTRIRRGLSLPIFEDGLESRDFVYVDDVVNAVALSIFVSGAHGKILNIGSGVPSSVMKVSKLLHEMLRGKAESDPQVTRQYRVGDVRHCYADIELAKQILGWHPEISLEQGISQFVQWVMQQPLPEDALDQALNEMKAKNMAN